MHIFLWISSILYILFVLAAAFGFGSITFNDREIENPFVRGLVALIVWPLIGLIFWVIGVIGNFLLMPFSTLLEIVR